MLTAASIPLFLATLEPAAPSLVWWTTSALEKVRPFDTAPAAAKQSVEVYAARNEFEPFQVVFRGDTKDISSIDIDAADLTGPHGAIIPKQNVAIYFERFIDLERPSSIEGRAGEWPDPLIPRTDRYAGEQRNAFPFKLRAGRSQPIWFEIFVPPDAPPGAYEGSITIWADKVRHATVPVSLHVWNFSLPSTSTLPNSFGFNGISAVHQHFGRYTNDDDVYRLTHIYAKAALWHRISIHGGSMAPPRFQLDGGRMTMDWSSYDAEVGPFLDGKVFEEDEPLFGAKSTSAELRNSNGLDTDRTKMLYWQEYAKHFRENGWGGRLFNYLWDEPAPRNYNELLRLGRLVHQADGAIKNLVTAPIRPEWIGVIDVWTPLINCFEYKKGFDPFCNPMAERSSYNTDLANGRRLWWYQSCASHGCDIVGGEYFRGWPSYMIDYGGVSNRIMQWMAWKYDVGGELYFNLDEAFSKKDDAWTDVTLFGGNGDGTMFYPGRPRNIGGKTDIPIESIRLKLVREGLEDYEYLTLLMKRSGSDAVSRFVNQLVTNAYSYERDPDKLYQVRRQIGEELNRLSDNEE